MLAPLSPTAMLWAECGRSTAAPSESGSVAPALQSRITVHAKVKCARQTEKIDAQRPRPADMDVQGIDLLEPKGRALRQRPAAVDVE
jgi:hypothetical protein